MARSKLFLILKKKFDIDIYTLMSKMLRSERKDKNNTKLTKNLDLLWKQFYYRPVEFALGPERQ